MKKTLCLVLAALFVFTLALTGMGVNYYLGKKVLPLPKYRWLYFYACLILVILFAVFRNLTEIIL